MLLNALRYATLGLVFSFLAASPSSTNYILRNYDFGNGGGSGSSANYKLNGISGSQSRSLETSANYNLQSGLVPAINANVPAAPTFTNPSSEYNRLKLVLNTASNPTDTKYLIAISPDNFATTFYVQTDNSIGSTKSISNYQTYTSWGGASGFFVTGLNPGLTYKAKVSALQGNYSESAFGPAASATTIQPTLSFSVTTTLSGVPPFITTFTSLTAGSVVNANADVLVDFTTNARFGGTVYIKSTGALSSASASSSLSSATADLSVAGSGYGAIVTSTSSSSGGPVTSVSPYDGASNSVGALSTSLQKILSSSAAVSSGNGTIRLKAKASSILPSANDYTDSINIVAAMLF